jgi:hypothetical protein
MYSISPQMKSTIVYCWAAPASQTVLFAFPIRLLDKLLQLISPAALGKTASQGRTSSLGFSVGPILLNYRQQPHSVGATGGAFFFTQITLSPTKQCIAYSFMVCFITLITHWSHDKLCICKCIQQVHVRSHSWWAVFTQITLSPTKQCKSKRLHGVFYNSNHIGPMLNYAQLFH